MTELGAEGCAPALAEHRRTLRAAVERYAGAEVDTQGDSFFVAFATAQGALAAAVDAQRELAIPVRMGIHTGTPLLTTEGYVGPDVHTAARIAAAGSGGQILLSQATCDLVDAEVRDLGNHRLKDLSAPERIYQVGLAEFPRLKTLYQTNLPVAATPLVGREREVSEVTKLLVRDDVRLVTLTGPGGSGKTRLALHAAAEVADSYPEGVFWAGLAPLRNTMLLSMHVGQVLGAQRGDLAGHIGDKRLLLVLDNFEHVIGAAPDVGALLKSCPRLDVLITSRERLQLDGEHEWAVPPLPSHDAVALFAQRAKAVGVEVETAGATAELCKRLDNLPLALELAAARTKLFAPSQLLERISQRLDLLKGGRDADPRQETLRATIDWSHDLLTPEEQHLFARLSVFAGGATIETAEAVCGASADALASLIDKSLARKSGERIWMLETIREYAAERLEASGEAEAFRSRHAKQFLALAEDVALETVDGDIVPWLPQLDAEAANIRTALTYFSDAGETEPLARTATPLWHYWAVRNIAEGRAWLVRATQTADTRLRAHAFYGLAVLASRTGELVEATAAANEALLLHERAGDAREAARSTVLLGTVASRVGELDRAFALYERAAELMRTSGDRAGLATALGNLGYVALERGDYDEAILREREALTLHAELGRRDQVPIGLINLGYASLGKHDDEAADDFFADGLRMAYELGDTLEIAYCLEGLAAVAVTRDAEHAAKLLGAAEAARESVGGSLESVELKVHERTVDRARAQNGDDAFQAGWESGRAITIDASVTLALDQRSDYARKR